MNAALRSREPFRRVGIVDEWALSKHSYRVSKASTNTGRLWSRNRKLFPRCVEKNNNKNSAARFCLPSPTTHGAVPSRTRYTAATAVSIHTVFVPTKAVNRRKTEAAVARRLVPFTWESRGIKKYAGTSMADPTL